MIDKSAKRYISPDLVYEPHVYFDRFRNYYYRTYELVYQPGYVSETSEFFVETNFYELEEGKLLWSGRSVLFNPAGIDTFVPQYAKDLF